MSLQVAGPGLRLIGTSGRRESLVWSVGKGIGSVGQRVLTWIPSGGIRAKRACQKTDRTDGLPVSEGAATSIMNSSQLAGLIGGEKQKVQIEMFQPLVL